MPIYILHLNQDPFTAPRLDRFESDTDARAAEIALMQFKREKHYAYAELHGPGSEYLILRRQGPHITASWTSSHDEP